MNPEIAYLWYLLAATGLAIIATVIGAISMRANVDIEREKLPVMLRRQAD